jgi:23S rRNA (guanosine2251-2'-O)-methyltransferase
VDSVQRKGRGRSDLVVFGRRAVLEALASEWVEVSEVRVSRAVEAGFRKDLSSACRHSDVPLEVGRPDSVTALSREPRHDQGVAARVRLLRLMELESFVDARKGAAAAHPARVLALDGVTNSQNIGMIVRSLVAAGLDAMLWPLVGSPWVNGLVVKASAATVFGCPIIRCSSLIQGLAGLQAAGFSCVGLSADADLELYGYAPPHRAVFVVGSETGGISADVEALIDERVRIPMRGGVESLNVAVAASLVCFHVGRG